MKNIVFPDYKRSLMNVTSTILDYYGVPTKQAILPILKEELKKGYRNIVFLLVDAMGSEILLKHSNEATYLIENQIDTLTTVFPSTTVSATTSALTGLPPIETGWIGWLQYVKEENKSVIFFLNKDFYDEHVTFDYNINEKIVPVKKVYELIEEANPNVKAIEVFPKFRTPKHDSFERLLQTTQTLCQEEGEHFIYTYWDQLDTDLHKTGTTSEQVKHDISDLNLNIKRLKEALGEDTLIIATADHGQLDIEEIPLWEYEDITKTFLHQPSVEARATAFFIKENQHEAFVQAFNRRFSEWFILYKTEDFLATKLLGEGKAHERIPEFLGDFFAVAIDRYSFKLSNSKRVFKAQHAGLTKEEMLIPLILLGKKNKSL